MPGTRLGELDIRGGNDKNNQEKPIMKDKKMKRKNLATLILAIAAVIMILTASPAVSQEKQADNMKILLDKIKADKKLLVAANMDLTEWGVRLRVRIML